MCPAYKRYFVPNSIVFLTMATAGRRPLFDDAVMVASALEILKQVKNIHPFMMKAYVVMPDHIHLLIHTQDGRFDRIIHLFKRNVSFEFHKRGICEGAIWQNRFYDRVIRDDEDLRNHMDYIHFNPVHHNHTSRPADYPFSSFHHYAARGWYPPDWGSMVPDNIKNMNLS